MELAQDLKNTGVSLERKVGLIVERRNDADQWVAVHASIGFVQTSVPDSVADKEELQGYDPEY